MVIPAGTYDGQAEEVATAAVGNFIITHDGLSEETAYQMTRLLFDNIDRMTAAHAAATAIDSARALEGMPVPLHPAAERHYKEIGLMKLTGRGAPRERWPTGAHCRWRRAAIPQLPSRACRRLRHGLARRIAFGIAVAFSAFQLYTAAYGTLPSQVVRAMHVGILLLLGFALLANLRATSTAGKGWFWLLAVLGCLTGLCNWVFYVDLIRRSGFPDSG